MLELYNLKEDFSQTTDLAAKYPKKVKEMKKIFIAEAKKSRFSRWTPPLPRKTVATAGRACSLHLTDVVLVGKGEGNAPSFPTPP